MAETQTRTYTVTGSPRLLDRFERLLALIHYAGAWGHSGRFGMPLDGDGPERIKIEPVPEERRKGVDRIGGVGYDVELAIDRGFSGVYVDRDRESRRAYTDDGEALRDD